MGKSSLSQFWGPMVTMMSLVMVLREQLSVEQLLWVKSETGFLLAFSVPPFIEPLLSWRVWDMDLGIATLPLNGRKETELAGS